MRFMDGGSEVPVPMRLRVEVEGSEGEGVRWKYRRGTLPHVRGPMKDAMAFWPGWMKRSNLCTLLGVLPAAEKSWGGVS
jgi:hypothetical protein